MKNGFFTKVSLLCLLCLLIVVAASNTNKASTNQGPLVEKNCPEKSDKSLQEPIEYVLGKLKEYDLVMIGERHWTHEEPVFIQNLIKRCFEKNAIGVVFLEFGNFEDQGKIEAFLEAAEYNPKPVIEALRNTTEFGWGYQEYFDIFKIIYDKNKKRTPAEKIKIVLVDGPPSDIEAESKLYQCFDGSSFSEKEKWHKVSWLRECIKDRDQFMAEVIATYLFDASGKKGIYYAGSKHIRKDLRKKGYGRRLFSAGGILSRKYPGRVCCLTFHQQPKNWQKRDDFRCVQKLFTRHGKSFAIGTNDALIKHLMLKSDTHDDGTTLEEAFDGYIMLNLDRNYHPCSFVPGFYDDEFAKTVWDKLRKRGVLKRLPKEFERFKIETPTGEELRKMRKEGLR